MLKILSYQRHYLCACWVARIPLSYSVAGGAPSAQWQDVGAAPRVALPINLWPTRRGEGDSPKLSVLSCQFTEKRRVPQGPPSDDEDGVPQSTFPLCLGHPPTPRPRFPNRTWGTLRDCSVSGSGNMGRFGLQREFQEKELGIRDSPPPESNSYLGTGPSAGNICTRG